MLSARVSPDLFRADVEPCLPEPMSNRVDMGWCRVSPGLYRADVKTSRSGLMSNRVDLGLCWDGMMSGRVSSRWCRATSAWAHFRSMLSRVYPGLFEPMSSRCRLGKMSSRVGHGSCARRVCLGRCRAESTRVVVEPCRPCPMLILVDPSPCRYESTQANFEHS